MGVINLFDQKLVGVKNRGEIEMKDSGIINVFQSGLTRGSEVSAYAKKMGYGSNKKYFYVGSCHVICDVTWQKVFSKIPRRLTKKFCFQTFCFFALDYLNDNGFFYLLFWPLQMA